LSSRRARRLRTPIPVSRRPAPESGTAASPEPGDEFYSEDELRALAAYAADRFVTIVPEIDTPGHATALMRLHPELNTGRNDVDYEVLPGHQRHAVWLDPELPATFGLMEQVLAGVAAIFPGPYLHIGADEPRAMPDEAYMSYVRRLRRLVRSLGRRPLGWQETARAGLRPDDAVQFWLTGFDLPPDAAPPVRAQVDAELALARRDVEAAVSVPVPVIVSPLPYCYLDVPYAEPPADAALATPPRRTGSAVSACGSMHPGPSPSRSAGTRGRRSDPAGPARSRASRPRSGPRPSPASTTWPSCCCPGCPASPTRRGAPRGPGPGPPTAAGSPGTAACGPRTAWSTSAPPPSTGTDAVRD
jgi:N-acetyl-beta-hexosaminidase